MEDWIKQILRQNNISSSAVEKQQVSPEDNRANYEIQASDKEYLLSVYRDRGLERFKSIKERMQSEVYFYKLANSEVNMNCPKIIDFDNSKYILLKKLRGNKLIENFKNSSKKERHDITEEVAGLMAEIHRKEYNKHGLFDEKSLNQTFDSWNQMFAQKLDKTSKKAETDLENRAIQKLYDDKNLTNQEFKPTLLHGDLHPWNIIVEDGKFVVIDGESSFSGPKEYDLAQTMVAWSDKFDMTEKFLDSYCQKIELKHGWESRIEYYKTYLFVSALIGAKEVGWKSLVSEFEERLNKHLKNLD